MIWATEGLSRIVPVYEQKMRERVKFKKFISFIPYYLKDTEVK